jgi:hypothetical protein
MDLSGAVISLMFNMCGLSSSTKSLVEVEYFFSSLIILSATIGTIIRTVKIMDHFLLLRTLK